MFGLEGWTPLYFGVHKCWRFMLSHTQGLKRRCLLLQNIAVCSQFLSNYEQHQNSQHKSNHCFKNGGWRPLDSSGFSGWGAPDLLDFHAADRDIDSVGLLAFLNSSLSKHIIKVADHPPANKDNYFCTCWRLNLSWLADFLAHEPARRFAGLEKCILIWSRAQFLQTYVLWHGKQLERSNKDCGHVLGRRWKGANKVPESFRNLR